MTIYDDGHRHVHKSLVAQGSETTSFSDGSGFHCTISQRTGSVEGPLTIGSTRVPTTCGSTRRRRSTRSRASTACRAAARRPTSRRPARSTRRCASARAAPRSPIRTATARRPPRPRRPSPPAICSRRCCARSCRAAPWDSASAPRSGRRRSAGRRPRAPTPPRSSRRATPSPPTNRCSARSCARPRPDEIAAAQNVTAIADALLATVNRETKARSTHKASALKRQERAGNDLVTQMQAADVAEDATWREDRDAARGAGPHRRVHRTAERDGDRRAAQAAQGQRCQPGGGQAPRGRHAPRLAGRPARDVAARGERSLATCRRWSAARRGAPG
jgi:hypothetical protein